MIADVFAYKGHCVNFALLSINKSYWEDIPLVSDSPDKIINWRNSSMSSVLNMDYIIVNKNRAFLTPIPRFESYTWFIYPGHYNMNDLFGGDFEQ